MIEEVTRVALVHTILRATNALCYKEPDEEHPEVSWKAISHCAGFSQDHLAPFRALMSDPLPPFANSAHKAEVSREGSVFDIHQTLRQ